MTPIHKILSKLAPFVPAKIGQLVRRRMSLQGFDLARRRAGNPYHGDTGQDFNDCNVRFGVIEDVTQYHKYYIAACRELGVSYRVLDLLANDWIADFTNADCDAFLVWPTSTSTVYKQLFDYRLYMLQHELNKTVYPSWKECWLTEHKPRLRDWLDANGIEHPNTWVFYDRTEALEFAKSAPIPIVLKTATGASASGISIIKSRKKLVKSIKTAFGRGLTPRSFDPRDRQRGFAYLQEYLPNVKEWRMERIGDSFFGYRKEPGATGIHSASHNWSWLDPGQELLNLTKAVTETGNFRSMDVDFFETDDGRFLLNECQTTFGCSTPAKQMKINDVEGRYLWDNGEWRFEPGEFCANHMCNLRVQWLLDKVATASLPLSR